jgi:hypothetical protein
MKRLIFSGVVHVESLYKGNIMMCNFLDYS